MDEWEEKCNLCGRMTSKSKDGAVYRLIKDDYTYRANWEELCVICIQCFTDIFLAGVKLRGGLKGKEDTPHDNNLF